LRVTSRGLGDVYKRQLLGTHRARLIDENKIIEKNITLSDLANYTSLKYVNAMMLWEESPEIEIREIVY
jgi:hypothetical protein